ncbi:hypothetical protein IKQ26_02835 [bacterium]|nr:hypothetical protein [bacterium]
MNKIVKILLINLIIFLIGYIAVDFYCFVKDVRYHGRLYALSTPLTAVKYYLNTYSRIFYSEKDYENIFIYGTQQTYFRSPLNLESKKKPVMIMGCSYAYGSDLNPRQSFMGKLVKYADRPVYNRAISARGVNEMYFQVRTKKFYYMFPKPEWFIYVFIPDQIRRAQLPCSIVDNGVYFDENFNIKPNFNTPLVYTFKNSKNYINNPEYIKHYLSVMHEIKNETQKQWGDDIKYLFLFYDTNDFLYEQLKPSLSQDGFMCLSLNDLTDVDLTRKEYKAPDNAHPSEKAWELLTPLIIEKTGI